MKVETQLYICFGLLCFCIGLMAVLVTLALTS